MNKYIYKNKLKTTWNESKCFWHYEVIFECFAQNIVEADNMFLQKTGNDPQKINYIGVSIVFNDLN